MPDRRGEHTKQQIRELGQAVRKAAREVDRSYPNTKQGDHIVRDFRYQTNRIVQGGRQHSNRSLGGSLSDSDLSTNEVLQLFLCLAMLVLTVVLAVILILFL